MRKRKHNCVALQLEYTDAILTKHTITNDTAAQHIIAISLSGTYSCHPAHDDHDNMAK